MTIGWFTLPAPRESMFRCENTWSSTSSYSAVLFLVFGSCLQPYLRVKVAHNAAFKGRPVGQPRPVAQVDVAAHREQRLAITTLTIPGRLVDELDCEGLHDH